MKKAICLIGFMGSGKTTVGKSLESSLGTSWVDLDDYIEATSGETIKVLFENKGETYFRNIEAACMKKALEEAYGIISTGGGVIVTEENREILKNQHTFYLKYDYDTLYNRIAGDENRPLASTYEEVKARYQQRQGLYEATAKYIIDCEGKEVEEIVAIILERMQRP